MLQPEISWDATHKFVAGLALPSRLPTAGSQEWCAAEDAVKMQALVIAGDRWALEQEILHIRRQRAQMKAAAIEIAAAKQWSAVARQLRDRDAFLRDNADWAIRRVVA